MVSAPGAMPVNAGRFAHPAWRMLIIAFLAQNCAIGMNFGIYGTIVAALEANYQTSRALAASGLAVMTMVMGLLSPVAGELVRRYSIRTLMIAGTLVNAVGYVLLAFAPSIEVVLLIYGAVIGPGVCLLGVIPSSSLVSNWFLAGKGRALGFVNMPVFVAIFPLLTALVLERFGLVGVFLMAAAISLLLVLALVMVVSSPGERGLKRYGESEGEAEAQNAGADAEGPVLTGRQINASRSFQVIWLGIGLLTAGGVMMTTHIVPLALDKGLELPAASLLLSSFGVCAAAGALLFGWLADRIGGQKAIVVQAFTWTLPWAALLLLGASAAPLIIVAGLLGLISGAIVGLCGVVVSAWLGSQNFAAAMGYVYFYKVPFLFGAAPLAGYLYDRTGGYDLPVIIHIATFVFVGLMFAFFRPRKIGDAVSS
ncbi:MFS transporter [Novosphingobium marinum]|nr:MFS transporter [Novosphingobium marinum]